MKPINAEKIITVNYTTHAVAKRKPEEIQACRDPNPNLCDTGAALWLVEQCNANYVNFFPRDSKVQFISNYTSSGKATSARTCKNEQLHLVLKEPLRLRVLLTQGAGFNLVPRALSSKTGWESPEDEVAGVVTTALLLSMAEATTTKETTH